MPRKTSDLNAQFVALFTQVELALKSRLKVRGDSRIMVSQLIHEYATRNPLWRESAERLHTFREIRNFLAHQSGSDGDPVLVTQESVEALRSIAESLIHPEFVATRFRRDVTCVSKNDELGKVLRLAFECGYSQFPIVDDGRFGGLITENEIVRWMGHRVQRGSSEVTFSAVRVAQVVTEKDPTMTGIPIFKFISLDAPVDEAIAMFATEQALEVLLLAKSGTKHTPIEGIITQWDAARFTS